MNGSTNTLWVLCTATNRTASTHSICSLLSRFHSQSFCLFFFPFFLLLLLVLFFSFEWPRYHYRPLYYHLFPLLSLFLSPLPYFLTLPPRFSSLLPTSSTSHFFHIYRCLIAMLIKRVKNIITRLVVLFAVVRGVALGIDITVWRRGSDVSCSKRGRNESRTVVLLARSGCDPNYLTQKKTS